MKTEQMINSSVALSGMYKFSIQRSGGTVEETGWMDNMILDSGLDQLGTGDGNSLTGKLQVGTGTNPVVATQTSLQTFLATARQSNNSYLNKGAPLYQSEITYEYSFPQGSVVGNITEVGVGSALASSNLFSRCLITDSAGVPTTLSVAASDQLIVYYKLTVFPDVTDTPGSLVLNGVTYDYVSRGTTSCNTSSAVTSPDSFSYITASTANETCTGLAPITGSPNGQSGQSNRLYTDFSTYVPGSHQLTYGVVFSPSEVTTPIKAIVLSGTCPGTQFVFTPPIPKSNINQLALTFNRSWGRG